ncbi:MAG: hypothetical protein SGARI_001384 [Bacillariaceae sp.]
MIVTRNSKLRQGSMGCVLVRPPNSSTDQASEVSILSAHLITAANNMPLFKTDDSAIHAEICALGKASRNGISTDGATAFITMPPCKRCFSALVAAGIQRIVTRHELPAQQQDVARLHGMSFAAINKEDMAKCHERIQRLVNSDRKRKETEADEKKLDTTGAKKPRADDD